MAIDQSIVGVRTYADRTLTTAENDTLFCFMIKKKFKLPIQNFFNKRPAKPISSAFFVLKLFQPEFNYSRFGLVISAKLFKKAVDRNRMKRKIFDFLRLNQPNLPIYDYLFILRKEASSRNIDFILEDLRKLFDHLR